MVDVTKFKWGEYNQFKVGTFNIDTTTATGTQAVTGVGFTPTSCVFFASEAGEIGEMSTGMDDGSTPVMVTDRFVYNADAYYAGTLWSIWDYDAAAGGKTYRGDVNSWDSDGFTIGWEKLGLPTGTLTVIYVARA